MRTPYPYALPVHVTRASADCDLVVSPGDVGDKGQKGGVGRHGKIGPIGSKGISLTPLAHAPLRAHQWALGEQLAGVFIVCALHVIGSALMFSFWERSDSTGCRQAGVPPPCRADELPGLRGQSGGPFEQQKDGILDAPCVHLPLGGSDFLGLGGSSPRASGPPSPRLTRTTLEGGLERRGPGQSRGDSASCTAPSTFCQRMISEPLAYLHLCWTPRLLMRQAGLRSHGGFPQVLLQVLAAGDRGWGGPGRVRGVRGEGAWLWSALPSAHTLHHSPGQGALLARAGLGQGRSLWPPSGEIT